MKLDVNVSNVCLETNQLAEPFGLKYGGSFRRGIWEKENGGAITVSINGDASGESSFGSKCGLSYLLTHGDAIILRCVPVN